jgi:hypothetical protein
VRRPSLAKSFAGIVPSSRGAHCRPLHPRLASLCSVETELVLTEESSHKTGLNNSTGTPYQGKG